LVDLAFGQQQVEDLAPPEVVDCVGVDLRELPARTVGQKNAVGVRFAGDMVTSVITHGVGERDPSEKVAHALVRSRLQ
jgi:hypothetical protein